MQPRKLAILGLAVLVAVVVFLLSGPVFSCNVGHRLAARFGGHRAGAMQYAQPTAIVADPGPGYEARPYAASPTGWAWFKIEIDFGPKPKPKPEPEPQPEPAPDKHPWWPLFGATAPPAEASGQARSCDGGSCCPNTRPRRR